MNAFVVATPYQLFICINVIFSQNRLGEDDLFVFSFAADMTELIGLLRKNGIFKNVYLLKKIEHFSRIGLLRDFIFTSRTFIKMVSKEEYKYLYVTYTGIRNNIIYKYILRKNPCVKVFFFEEGLGTYEDGYKFKTSRSYSLLKMFGFPNVEDRIEKILVYEPAMMHAKLYGVGVSALPKIDKSNKMHLDLFNKIFFVSKQDFLEYTGAGIIYFDQDFYKYRKEEEMKFLWKISHQEIINMIKKIYPFENIIVKLHPITELNAYATANCQVASKKNIPWEVIAMNIGLQNRILVTVNSTCVFSPKFIYNDEPKILILGEMLVNEGLTTIVSQEEIKSFYFLKSCYLNPERIMIPKSFNELELLQDSIK